MNAYASVEDVIARSMLAWRPPARLSLSEWADEFFVMPPEISAQPGKWKTLPYQKGILDAITDPAVEQVSVKKSARIGFTLMFCAGIGYYIEHDPSSMLVVQPIVDDSKNFSKEAIAGILRDVPVLRGKVYSEGEKGARTSSNTLQHKLFRGGVLSLTGANSGTGFRRITRRVLFGDEVDAWPMSAGNEGDPLLLAKRRTSDFWNRKIVIGSTPLVAGLSRITEEFEKGDQRRYYVPCPHCERMDFLTFREKTDGEAPRGHYMRWDEGKPETAHFLCRGCGCVIEHKDKRWMIERGEWRAEKPFAGHASFAIWAAYSYSPNATWAKIAAEFLEANAGGPEKLKTFVNTVLGETWIETGDVPDWQKLYQRREAYAPETVPAGVVMITVGVDVQRDRLVWDVVGWGADFQSWGISAGEFHGDTAKEGEGPWLELDELLTRTWPRPDGALVPIRMLAIDSGDQTQIVYRWARRYPLSRVIATKGSAKSQVLVDAPSRVDVMVNGKKHPRGYRVWPVAVSMAKSELYGWLQLDPPTDEDRATGATDPMGFCHFPASASYGERYFKQLTAEQLVAVKLRSGFKRHEWQLIAGRENHWLDCRVYARAAAFRAGLDRYVAAKRAKTPPPAPPPTAPTVAPPPARAPEPAPATLPPTPSRASPRPGWLQGGRGSLPGRGSWLGRGR